MRNCALISLVLCITCGADSALAGTAQVQVANNSVRFYPGSCSYGFGLVFKLHFSTSFTEDPRQANGEMSRRPVGSPTTHWAYMLLEDPSMWTSTTIIEVDLPLKEDFDRNGVPDLLEPNRDIAMATSGVYYSDLGEGSLTFSFARKAGERIGTCAVHMDDPIFGRMGPFQHLFEIFHYTGDLDYSRTTSKGFGKVGLRQDALPAWAGWLEVVRSPSDPCNVLTLQQGGWTNVWAETFTFEEATLRRDPGMPSTYSGTLQNPAGPFASWTIQITDKNDSNNNGVPDLSDEITVQPPKPARLLLKAFSGRLELTIEGEAGRSYDVETSRALGGLWQVARTVLLTNSVQSLDLTQPTGTTAVWRVVTR